MFTLEVVFNNGVGWRMNISHSAADDCVLHRGGHVYTTCKIRCISIRVYKPPIKTNHKTRQVQIRFPLPFFPRVHKQHQIHLLSSKTCDNHVCLRERFAHSFARARVYAMCFARVYISATENIYLHRGADLPRRFAASSASSPVSRTYQRAQFYRILVEFDETRQNHRVGTQQRRLRESCIYSRDRVQMDARASPT